MPRLRRCAYRITGIGLATNFYLKVLEMLKGCLHAGARPKTDGAHWKRKCQIAQEGRDERLQRWLDIAEIFDKQALS